MGCPMGAPYLRLSLHRSPRARARRTHKPTARIGIIHPCFFSNHRCYLLISFNRAYQVGTGSPQNRCIDANEQRERHGPKDGCP